MSTDELINENTIFLDVAVGDSTELFTELFPKLFELGYVTAGFLEALIERENKYPTGLKGRFQPLAIPHADPLYILKPFIAVVRLLEPIIFQEMTGQGLQLEVQSVFILGLKSGEEQLQTLKAIIEHFAGNQDTIKAFFEVQTAKECLALLQPLVVKA